MASDPRDLGRRRRWVLLDAIKDGRVAGLKPQQDGAAAALRARVASALTEPLDADGRLQLAHDLEQLRSLVWHSIRVLDGVDGV